MVTLTPYSMALDYHENTKSLSSILPYDERAQYKIYPATKTIPLKKNYSIIERQDKDIFMQTLLSRKSTRAFSDESIDMATLSKLLTLSCGLRNDGVGLHNRTYASAGGRYPIEVYIVLFKPSDIEPGIYHFNVLDNNLEMINAGNQCEGIRNFYSNQDGIIATDYPCLILFSMVFKRTMEKYGERGYRFILLDAGHMGQNLYMVSTYLGLGIVGLGAGSKSDDEIDNYLGLTSSEENVFYGFAVGHPQKLINAQH